MSERKIKYWGANAGQAFGYNGYKGMKGEHWYADYYASKGYNVELFEETRKKQVAGIDVILSKEDGVDLTVDVKNNLKKDNSFYVEVLQKGWLFNPKKKSDYISHVNPTTGVIGTYTRQQMQNYILEHYVNYEGEIILLHKDTPGLEFIRWTFTKETT